MTQIPINSNVLKWARETAGFSVEELQKSFPKYPNWENEKSFPTYKQLEDISKKFKRPVALFFFPEPPEEEPVEKSLRALSEENVVNLAPKVRFLFRKGKAFQASLLELLGEEIPQQIERVGWLEIEKNETITQTAERIRNFFGVSVEKQVSWRDSEEALKEWRNILADKGIFVFKEAFKSDKVSGFCLYDKIFPIIFINNSHTFNRQIFTLFHELAHLVYKQNFLDVFDAQFWKLETTDPAHIEVKCNSFAGNFLVPNEDFVNRASSFQNLDEELMRLSRVYNVSSQVILRKFLDKNKINQELFEDYMAEWQMAWKQNDEGPRGGGGNYYYNQKAYLGDAYLSLVLSRYHQGKISQNRASDFLGIKAKNFGKLEEVFLS